MQFIEFRSGTNVAFEMRGGRLVEYANENGQGKYLRLRALGCPEDVARRVHEARRKPAQVPTPEHSDVDREALRNKLASVALY
jgi:hypothetical protein